MHKDMNPITKNAITLDATRTIAKWLNEPTDAPLDRVALATVLARVGFLELELQALKNAFEAAMSRTAAIEMTLQQAYYELRQTTIMGNYALNERPTHYSSEPYQQDVSNVMCTPSGASTELYTKETK